MNSSYSPRRIKTRVVNIKGLDYFNLPTHPRWNRVDNYDVTIHDSPRYAKASDAQLTGWEFSHIHVVRFAAMFERAKRDQVAKEVQS